mgnify:CR=1 FL=1
MAFATSAPELISTGSAYCLIGTWTGEIGNANGSVTGAGYCTDATFKTNSSASPVSVVPTRISNSSGTWTVTVPNVETVTAGTYEIHYR